MSKQFCIVNLKGGIVQNRKPVAVLFQSLKDGKYLLEISGADKRSNPQNRYYWGLVVPLIQKGIKDLGTELTKEETHEFLKARFNTEEIHVVDKKTGELLYESIPKSTTRLNKEDFSKYIEQIQRWAAEFLSIVIPDPGVQLKAEYE